ncbi:flagellar biosynthesis protein FlhF [Fictibacillus phosphorivorans]|uniref:flagellar biosynthesis protein FlhF n=1 Tax=Fictibacillus phosphorivorans TaxID=1221500 RepID=UPI0020423593|nr:flagellar biosynthesis protein FlhF [Fictibacillus phosphorivorans]MCM3717141.1 flagellar biosynthesis protein FlhF [Fictibacillus phosphorivorans]MCM3774828.1 flagellar biosynthesis protein FlhF [Fictibacillus phosphorivorans]
MKVKKYTANSLPEAMKLVRADLGSGAVILNTREVQAGGFLGFFTKKNIEIFAGLDQDIDYYPKKSSIVNHEPVQNKSENEELTYEIRQLKQMVHSMTIQKKDNEPIPEFAEKWRSFLERQELEQNISEEIINQLTSKYLSLDPDESEVYDWNKWMIDWFSARMKKSEFGGFHYEAKFLNLIGPTGVGKTTTIAKIGAKAVLKDRKRVAFITTDTYRIAAIEQLKTYAEILNIPCEVAYTADDFKKAKEKFKDYDLVLVDSAGRNFLNRFYIEELQRIVQFDKDMKNYLVLSLTSKYKDMETIYSQFKSLPVHKVIFTKKDETSTIGAMLNLAINHSVPISYITNGQNVPDDMFEADAEELVQMLLKEKLKHD